MLNLDAKQIVDCLTMDGLIHTMRASYQLPATTPQRRVMPLAESGYEAFALLPAWNEHLITVKAFTYFPENHLEEKDSLASKILAFDRRNGEPLALLDGKVLTYWRTAAASALAADYLSRRDSQQLLICGTGNLAPYIAWAYAAVRPLTKVVVWGRDVQKAKRCVDAIISGKEYQNLPVDRQYTVEVTMDIDQAVSDADIVSCVTGATSALFSSASVMEGTHIDLIGNHDKDKRECDSELVQRSQVYVDSKINVLAEAGDLLIPIAENVFKQEQIQGELPDLCAARNSGRKCADAITLYKSVGSALADLIAVQHVLFNYSQQQ